MPYIEFYRERPTSECILDSGTQFPRSNKEETLVKHLVDEIYIAKGDLVVYIEILMKFYQRMANVEQANAKKAAAVLSKNKKKNKSTKLMPQVPRFPPDKCVVTSRAVLINSLY